MAGAVLARTPGRVVAAVVPSGDAGPAALPADRLGDPTEKVEVSALAGGARRSQQDEASHACFIRSCLTF